MPQEKQQEKVIVEFVPFGGDSKIKLSINIIRELICVPTKSGKLCSDKDALKFMGLVTARKLNPFEGDCYLIGYDGREGPTFSLITAHQAFLKRAEVNKEFDGFESGVVVEKDGKIEDIQGDFTTGGQKVVGGWARVFFKTRSHPMYKRVRLSRFKKPFGVWLDDEAGMICKCAEADALRSSFPTMLGGLYLREETQPPAIEILEAKVETPGESGDRMRSALDNRISNGHGAASAAPPVLEQPPPPAEPTHTEAANPPQQAPPVRKRAAKLKPKEEPKEPTFRELLGKRLAEAGYNEDQFLGVCNKNEWLGKGRKWDSFDGVNDEMLAVFLEPEEWKTVKEQLDKLPKHTLD